MSDEYIYVDTAAGGFYNRNNVMKLSDYDPSQDAFDCFRTYLLFTEDFADYTEHNISPNTGKPSVSGYPGPAFAEYIPFDFDYEKDTKRAAAEAAGFVRMWETRWGIPPEALRIYLIAA